MKLETFGVYTFVRMSGYLIGMARPKRRSKSADDAHKVKELAAHYGIELPSEESSDRTLSPNEAARFLGVTGEAVKQWIYNRRLPAVKIKNGFWRIKASDLEQFLKDRSEGVQRNVLFFGIPDASVDHNSLTTQLKCRITVARSLPDGILKAHKLRPSVVVIRVESDSQDGWELAQEIHNSRTRPARMLLISNKTLPRDKVNLALSLEFDAFLSDPLDSQVLVDELRTLLS